MMIGSDKILRLVDFDLKSLHVSSGWGALIWTELDRDGKCLKIQVCYS